jgi:DNA polymerase-3 subunit epsilon/ATP-dependent DNA helicase DinG
MKNHSPSPVCVALDMEMTGRGESNEIVEIGAIKFAGPKVIDRFSSLVRPTRPITASVSALTGIRQSELLKAPFLSEVAPRLVRFVGAAPIVGQSIHFDLDLLAKEGCVLTNARFDTYELATIFLPNLAAYDLASIAKHLGIPVSRRHRALDDAELAMRVFLAIRGEIERLGYETLSELSALALSGSPLSAILHDVVRSKARSAFRGGYSLGDLLAAQGVDPIDLALAADSSSHAEALRPRYPAVPVDEGVLEADFATDGPLSRHLASYEVRPGQLAMMRLVLRTLNHGGTALIEAGTGTGKSLAYLLPAARFAMANDARVVVSTKTVNLQDQILFKDLPVVEKVVGSGLRTSLLKGRSNYLCLDRWKDFRRRPVTGDSEARLKARLLVWLKSTETGDRSELNMAQDEEPVWHSISAAADGCRPSLCREWAEGRCFLRRAKSKAEAAHVLVVNHSLLLADLAAETRVIPPYRHLIIDEAHHLEAEATDQFSIRVSLNTLASLVKGMGTSSTALGKSIAELGQVTKDQRLQALSKASMDEARRLGEHLDGLLDVAKELVSSEAKGTRSVKVRVHGDVRSRNEWQRMLHKVQSILPSMRYVGSNLRDLSMELTSKAPSLAALLEDGGKAFRANAEALEEVFLKPEDGKVYWLDAEDPEIEICGAPVYIGPLLKDRLFDRLDAVVLTSATLSVEGDFSFFTSRLGITNADELSVEAPFDYDRAVLVYVADDVPDPNSPGYQRAVEEHVARIVEAAEGRTLVLFTSNSALRATYRALEGRLARAKIVPLGQGFDGSRKSLLERFSALPRAVLFGSASFWEGIDVAGDALSVLIITRLPFEVPGDPVFSAKAEQFSEPFDEFAVPSAVLRFKQGFGRLIRSPQDRGVVVILDSRIAKRRYGSRFLRSLPECEIEVGPAWGAAEAVRRWLSIGS